MPVASCQHKLWCSTEDPTKKQICGRPGSNFFWLRHVWRWRRSACILSCLCNLSPWWVPYTYGNPYSSRTPNNDNRSLTRGFSGMAFMQTYNFLGWRNPGPPSRKVARKASWFLAARHDYWIYLDIMMGVPSYVAFIVCNWFAGTWLLFVYDEVTLLLDTWFVWRLQHWSMRDNRIIPD